MQSKESLERQDSSAIPTVSELHERHGSELLAFCRSRIGFHDGEEVYQTLWLKVMKNLNRFDGSNARAWLYTIARNTIHDFRKKMKPRVDSEMVGAEADARSITGLDGLISDEQKNKFQSCMETLEPLKQKLLQLRVLGESYKSISLALDIPSGTVGSRFSRVKDELKMCVEGLTK